MVLVVRKKGEKMNKEITCVDDCVDCLLFDDNSGICEESIIFINDYEHCNTKWTSSHDCRCNDHCPICDKEIEPKEKKQWTS